MVLLSNLFIDLLLLQLCLLSVKFLQEVFDYVRLIRVFGGSLGLVPASVANLARSVDVAFLDPSQQSVCGSSGDLGVIKFDLLCFSSVSSFICSSVGDLLLLPDRIYAQVCTSVIGKLSRIPRLMRLNDFDLLDIAEEFNQFFSIGG